MAENGASPGCTSFDADVQFSIEDLFECLKLQRRHSPRALRLVVDRDFLVGTEASEQISVDEWRAERGLEVAIHVVPTSIRAVYLPDYEFPEYDVEGWLFAYCQEVVWVRISIRTNNSPEVREASVYQLDSGQQIGTELAPELR